MNYADFRNLSSTYFQIYREISTSAILRGVTRAEPESSARTGDGGGAWKIARHDERNRVRAPDTRLRPVVLFFFVYCVPRTRACAYLGNRVGRGAFSYLWGGPGKETGTAKGEKIGKKSILSRGTLHGTRQRGTSAVQVSRTRAI